MDKKQPWFLISWFLVGLIVLGLGLLSALVCKEFRVEAALRAKLTPLQYAQHEVAEGDNAGAIRDLSSIPESSLEYAEARDELAAVEARVELVRPVEYSKAENECKEAIRSKEEFPSTVEMPLINAVSSSINPSQHVVLVAVRYTAKNSTGAELPYQVDCITTYRGDLLEARRHGR